MGVDGDLLPIQLCATHTALRFCLETFSEHDPGWFINSAASSCLSLLRAEIAGVCGHAWLVLPSEEICCCQVRGERLVNIEFGFRGQMATGGRMGVQTGLRRVELKPQVQSRGSQESCGESLCRGN